MIKLIFSLVLISLQILSSLGANPDIVFKNVDRTIDISNQLAKINYKIVLENTGAKAVDDFEFVLEPGTEKHISYFNAEGGELLKTNLKVQQTKISGVPANSPGWKIKLQDPLKPKSTLNVDIEVILTHILSPYPEEIVQKEKQLVRYFGNHYAYSLYKIPSQKTTVQLGTKKVESFSKLNPTSQLDTTLVYGPYKNVEPLSISKLAVHYENNSPFLVVTNLKRVIEVSHWGNIAVEEHIELHHVGAKLKGSFSRYEYQREAQSGQASVKSFKTYLPAAASDVYYRDEIGNISTSHYRELSDAVEIDLRPRFPLFGGWKTVYILGYNIPSYEYLFSSGSHYVLKIRFIDHIFDDMVIDNANIEIILPEYTSNIKIHTPFNVKRENDENKKTYLDTIGRPNLKISLNNLVENHIQDIEVEYTFNKAYLFVEPLLVAAALLIIFLFVIIYVRFDFKITASSSDKKKQQ